MEPQEKILKSSLALFFKYGIKHVTMDEIAKELGMSKKTIYQFYKEKDDLVNQLCHLQLNEQECEFETFHKDSSDAIHEIMLISEHMRQMMQNINPIFFKDLQKFYPTAYELYVKFREDCAYRHILKNIKKGKENGLYREELDPEFASRLRLAQIDMLIFGSYFNYDKISFSQTHQMLLDQFVYGITTVKGHNQYRKLKEEE